MNERKITRQLVKRECWVKEEDDLESGRLGGGHTQSLQYSRALVGTQRDDFKNTFYTSKYANRRLITIMHIKAKKAEFTRK